MKFHVTISSQRVTEKPKTKYEYGKIRNDIIIQTGVTMCETCMFSSPSHSRVVAPGRFNGSICNKNWVGQQLFYLDFDDGTMNPEQVIMILKEVGIIVNIWYETLSSTQDHPRFRIIIALNEEITDYQLAQQIRTGMVDAFPNADKRCKDAARIYLPGSNSYLINSEINNIQKVFEFATIGTISKFKGRISKMEQKTVPLYNSISDTGNCNFFKISSVLDPEEYALLIMQRNNPFNWEEARKIKVLDDFLNGVWLDYDSLLGLATNLNYIQGGTLKMRKTMEHFNKLGKTHYNENNFNVIKFADLYHYRPQWLKNFSKNEEDHQYSTIYNAVRCPLGYVDVIEPKKTVSLTQGRFDLSNTLNGVLESTDTYVHLIISSTGVGKTELIRDLENVTIAIPTHKLKSELIDRRTKPFVVSPELPKFANTTLNDKIKNLYNMGLHNKVYMLLKSIANDSKGMQNKSDVELCKNYLNELLNSKEANVTVLTSHDRSFFTEYKHNTIVYDEDPLSNLIDVKQLEISDFHRLKNQEENCILIQDVIYQLESAEPSVPIANPFDVKDKKELEQLVDIHGTATNLLQLFNCAFFVRDADDKNIVHYVTKRHFDENKKIIVLSATASVDIYRKLFGDRLKVHELDMVENTGKVIQDCSKSYSKWSMNRCNLDELKQKHTGKPVITHSTYSLQLNDNQKSMYFYNTEGYDQYNGKDIVVIGTPHLPPISYFLLAHAIGHNISYSDMGIKKQMVTYKNLRFPFSTFDNVELQKLQMGLIESELVQAVGRARAVSNNVEVLVYSNLALSIADQFTRNQN
jgi:hypothetical protein